MLRTTAWIASVLGCTVSTGFAGDARRIEVSPDGSQVVEMLPSPTDGMVTIHRVAAPYPAAPNWQNDIRRQVSSLEVADMNGDGWNDLVVGCYISQSYPPYTDWENLIYYNVGGQLEATASWVSADEVSTSDIKVGDINRDGYPDIFAANGNGLADNVMYYGSATGPDPNPDWISNEPENCWTNAAVLFDVDHDGDLDVFTGNQAVSPDPYRCIYGFKNNNGVLNPVPEWQSDERSIQGGLDFADLDGDGWEDLAVSKWSNFQSGVYRNLGGNLQTYPIWTTGDSGTDRGALWTDFTHDGWPDLLIGHNPPRGYSNINGTLAQTWQSATNSSAPQDMRVADVNRDGSQDFIEIQFSTGLVRLHLNVGGALETTPSWTYDSPGAGSALALGDINGDHWPDLVVGNSGQPCVFVFYAVPVGCPGDLDCDGDVDFFDIDPLVAALGAPHGVGWPNPNCPWLNADLDFDEDVDFFDIDPFILRLGQLCQ